MDLFLKLINGTTAGLKGVTEIASVDAYPTIIIPLSGASTTVNKLEVTVTSTTGLLPGMHVFGNGACSGQKVAGIVSATVFVMTHAADATDSGAMVATGVSADDMALLENDSGFYRDIFTAKTLLGTSSGATTVTESWDTSGIIALAGTAEITTTAVLAGKLGAPSVSISDDLRHFPLRQISYQEALWVFTCTDLTLPAPNQFLKLPFRKSAVLGMFNVPSDD